MKQPLVSVITPCFNSDRFIKSCVESVLAQEYRRVEHIIQDGASSDDSVDILRAYTGRVDWVSEPDNGQADGLNRAIKRSRGDILIVLNTDDELLPSAAAWGVAQMINFTDHAVIYGDLLFIDELGKETGYFLGPEYDFPGVFCVEKVIGAQAAFIRRSMLAQVGLGADAGLDTCPDYEMLVRLGLKFPMRHVPGFVTRYRYYLRPMDGSEARTVERFVRSKSAVMERVLNDPGTPKEIRRLRRRAKAGLFLWASQEARGMADIRGAWGYYAKAIMDFSAVGWLAGKVILAYLKWRDAHPPRTHISYSPNLGRAIFVGAGLAQQTRGLSIGFAFVYGIRNFFRKFFSALVAKTPAIIQALTTIGLLVLIVYLLLVIIR
jgi:glycosyltransferase involved in cell wall biosynthesis